MPRDRNVERVYSPARLIERLARIYDLTHPDGRPNYSAFSRRTGIPTATVARIHSGRRDAESSAERADAWVMTSGTIQKLMQAFSLTFEEASGQVEIPEHKARRKARVEATPADMDLLRQLRELPPRRQHEVRAFIEAQKRLERK